MALSACGALDIFGDDEEPLPGDRISVLSLEEGIQPDPSVSDVEIRLPPPFLNETWPQAGGNAKHVLYHLALSENPQSLWRADIGEGGSYDAYLLAQPVVAEGRAYTLDARTNVKAIDVDSGREVWEVDLEIEDEDDGFFGGGVAYSDGRIYVSTGFAYVFALDAATGEELWRARVPAPMRAAPTVDEGRVYVITVDNQTHAIDATEGNVIWTHRGIQETAGLVGGSSPAVDASTVVSTYSSGEIYALRAENGRELWSDTLTSIQRVNPIADLPDIQGNPVIDRGVVFAVSNSRRMVAIDLRRGARAWDIQLGGVQMPWVGGNFIYQLTTQQQLVALTRQDGRVVWVQDLPRYEDPEDEEDPISWYGPVLAEDRLIVASSTAEAWSVSPYDGRVLGKVDLPGPAAVSPIVVGGAVYFLTDNARLAKFR
ncbi:MAG: PQQ-binding-like beta-propeller repeat protein [Rhodovibrionaceae bacterium]|nr:PQQ-binding-like beta-propeller repeat protein [Rhodovibrionaceae bacterium]